MELRKKQVQIPAALPMSETSALKRAENPTSGMSGTEKFAAGAGKALVDLWRGVGDMAGLVSEEKISDAKRRDESLMRTGAGMAGNLVGNIAAFAPTAAIPGVNTIRGAALLGGGIGALTPTTEGESRLTNIATGAALGGAVQGAIKGGGAAFRTARNAIEPYVRPDKSAARALNEAAGGRRDAILDLLRKNTDDLATAGEAAAPAGSAEFSALQKVANTADPSATVARESAQASRRNQLLKRALNTDNLGSFKATRASQTAPFYKAIEESQTQVDVAPVMSVVDDLISKNKNRSALVNALKDVKGKLGDTSVSALKSTSDDISDMVSKKPPSGQPLNNAVVKKLLGVQEVLEKQIASRSPQFRQAGELYKKLSEPVNQAQIGKTLSDALNSPVSDLGAEMTQRSGSYATALRNAPQTIKKSTGFNRGKSLEDILTPNQMTIVMNVGEELANKANFEKLARVGTGAAKEVLGNVKPQQLPGILERNVVIANSILGRTGNAGTKRIVEYLAANMGDPKKIAEIMEGISPEAQRQVSALINLLKTTATTAAASSGT